MARFGVFRNPEGAGYLLDVQADVLGHLWARAFASRKRGGKAP